ncbi:MAG: hypothetical protein PHD66_01530 [Eubacteriales bacterium]|nr:hypothetical protein [Eubacteriales bacterium]
MKQKKLNWMRLDNAAKIFPAVKRKNWSNVFRLSATLKEPVDTLILQSALEVTVKRFPSMSVRISRGLFWYYLEEIEKVPGIKQDEPYPCSRMHFRDIRKCAFRVLYYRNRIAVEFFHALTDGNGGLVFLKTLIAEYLTQKYKKCFSCGYGVLDRNQEPPESELEDSFLKYEGPVSSSRKDTNSFRLTGTLERNEFLNITTGIIDVNAVLNKAKEYNVSLTAFLISVMIYSIMDIQNIEQPRIKRQKPVKIMLPVNLRNYFASDTLRNFVLYITPGIDPRYGEFTLEEIIKSVHHQMGFELTKKALNARLTTNVKAEKHLILKIMPLFIKNIALKLVYNMVGERKAALSFSNLGMVMLPEDISAYVDRLNFILGVQATLPSNCGVLSYKDKLYINFIRNIEEPVLEQKFFTNLKQLGITAKIESNQRDKYRYEISE